MFTLHSECIAKWADTAAGEIVCDDCWESAAVAAEKRYGSRDPGAVETTLWYAVEWQVQR